MVSAAVAVMSIFPPALTVMFSGLSIVMPDGSIFTDIVVLVRNDDRGAFLIQDDAVAGRRADGDRFRPVVENGHAYRCVSRNPFS